MARWITVAPGVRARDHATRKHGVKPDRYFTIRFTSDGKQVEEGLGWASEGYSLKRAQEELVELRKANRTGQGVATLREGRATAAARRKAEDQKERSEKTVAVLWERYVKEVMIANKPGTVGEKERMWRGRIEPAIGGLKVKGVSEEDAGAIVRAPLRLDGKGRAVGGMAESSNLYRLLHHMFKKALGWGLRPRELGNPLENVTKPKAKRRMRLLTGGEVGALLKELDKAEAEKTEQDAVISVIRATILTGWRISELLELQWSFIRRDEMEFHLPDTKTDFSRRPMSSDLLALLDRVTRMPGVQFVFRSADAPKEPLPYHTVERAFGRITKAAGVRDCTLHTMRHWFATMTANSVSNPRVGMALTGHKSHQAYMTYVHGDKAQARALADQLATLAVTLGRAESNVTDIRKTKQS
jgi:integrase